MELLKEPYPEKYDTPVFALFDGRKGSAMEYISKFLDSMGPFAAHGDLYLQEFLKYLVDRAYTWYTVLPTGSIRTWEDMVESFCSKYFHMEEKITLVNLHGTKQQIGEDLVKYIHHFQDMSLDCHLKYQEGELVELSLKLRKVGIRKSLPQTLTVSTATTPSGTKRKNSIEKVYEEPPPLPFTAEEMMAIFDKWVQDQVIKLPKITKQPTAEEQKDPKYCRYHRYVHHPTVDCRTLRWEVNLVIHGNVSDMEAEESAAASSSLIPAAVRTLQKSPKFKSLFNQLGFGPEARNAATEALITIATTNAINFTDEDMEVQYPDHRRPLYLSAVVKDVQVRRALVDTGSCLNLIPLSTLQAANVSWQKIQGSPMEVTRFGGVIEYTMGHVQLVLRVGPIVALTRFHVVNAEAPYHVLLGRPWLHKHKLVSSTYHQCVKGRLNGKPIRIAANSCPFDQIEAHFVEAALYDDLSSMGEPSIVRPCGTPLPAWEDIKDDPEVDLRELLERKKKRKEREVEHGSPPTMRACPTPQWSCCLSLMKTENSEKVVVDQAESTLMSSEEVMVDQTKSTVMSSKEVTVDHARSTAESTAMKEKKSTTAEPNMTAKEEFEVINLSADPNVSKPISISMSLSIEERKCLIDLLHEYKDVFAWDYDEMPGIDPGLVAHSLNVEPGTRPCGAAHENLPYGKKEFPLLWSTVCQQAFEKIRVIMTKLPTICAPVPGRPLRLYLASNSEAIGGLVAQEDENGTEKPIYFVSRALRDAETRYSGAEQACLALIYASQRLRHYFLAHKIQLMTKSHPIRSLLHRPVLSGRLAQWFLQLSQYEINIETPTAIKSQAIADLLAQFPGEDSSSISHEVPGGMGEALLANLVDSTWKLKFNGSSTSNSSGAGIVLIRQDGETIAKSFKLDFSYSNNASEYEAYITGLAIAHEMGIKHLRVIGDSNLIIYQTKGEFSLKEPSLALYRALAQKLKEKFDTFEISHAMRCENRYADALATLGSQVSFEESKVDVTIDKRSMPITDLLKEKFKEQNLDAEDWWTPIKAKLMSPEGVADLKVLKDYVLIVGDLYRRLPGGVLARCVNLQEAAKKLTEVHDRSCEFRDGVSLYRRLQRLGYFWPSMSKEAASLQEQCSFCQHQHEFDQIYATFISSDWRTPFLEYLIENILPQTSQAVIRLKKLAIRYFVEGGILFRKGFHGDPLRCLSLAESQTVMKEAHSGECGEHQGKKRLYQLLLTLGYYWPTMKKDTADFVKSCHTCQLQANLIHTHPTSLQNMATPWPFHTWGLDLIGPINPPSGGYIWILVATKYFSKWVEAIPLRKATGAAMANFIREHIITRFGIPHKIISDNGTPFINKNVREVLEHYRIKHRRSTPYYPQGNGQVEAINRMLLRILSKMVFDYGKGWSSHMADTLWAYRGSTKTATGFTPFSLIYGIDAISPTKLLVPSPRILHGMDLEADADICAEARVADLESLEEARELAQVRSLRYHQKLASAYEKTLQTRIFAKGQMILRTVDHVRRGLPSPSKFAPN
uniref:Integrase catalytic domain-containing protein n=1 Tax=Fagus sylvatica TaxID=28930 RepID=A0A2N9IR83_FAGSY